MGTRINISGVTITNGNVIGSGGGLNNNITNNVLVVDGCQFRNNEASVGGGGLASRSFTRIFNTTFQNNTADQGGAVDLQRITEKILINCTFNGNSSIITGAIFISSTVVLINSTISNNRSIDPLAGAVTVSGISILNIGNTVVAINEIGAKPDFSIQTGGVINSLGYNFIGNADGTTSFIAPGDQTGTTIMPIDPLLLPIANYGGQTSTMLPSPNSPLIDTGGNNLVNTFFVYPEVLCQGQPIDQRGFFRIFNGIVDIGAVEFGSSAVCYAGDSMVLTKNILTSKIKEIPASDVVSDIHQVFNMTDQMFVPINEVSFS